MTQCPVLTGDQRAAAKQWAIVGLSTVIVSIFSYTAALIYFATASQPNAKILGLWVFGTALARSLISRVCVRRMQEIAREKTVAWFGTWLWLVVAIVFMLMPIGLT